MSIRKEYYLLCTGQGISKLGSWIYLIALNLAVWHLTESPAAVAGIYIIGPIARIFSNFFVGSIVDRSNKKRILVMSDVFRGVIVCLMPFASSIWLIYSFIFLTNIASTFANPSSLYLITKLVNDKDRLRFNAINSILSSGSFMIGPAISGAIIALTNTSIAMWINGIALFVSASLMALLPNIQEKNIQARKFVTFVMIKSDFLTVWKMLKEKRTLLQFFVLYLTTLMIAFSLDSQEMSFLKDFHEVSDASYGIIVGITGIGAIIGGIAAAAFVHKLALTHYIGAGISFTLLCYFTFYISSNLYVAIVAFILLGLFMAFSNTGYATFYQKTIAPEMMGRFTSTLNLFESTVQITLTLLLGALAEWYSIQFVTSSFAFIGVLLAFLLYRFIFIKQTILIEE